MWLVCKYSRLHWPLCASTQLLVLRQLGVRSAERLCYVLLLGYFQAGFLQYKYPGRRSQLVKIDDWKSIDQLISRLSTASLFSTQKKAGESASAKRRGGGGSERLPFCVGVQFSRRSFPALIDQKTAKK